MFFKERMFSKLIAVALQSFIYHCICELQSMDNIVFRRAHATLKEIRNITDTSNLCLLGFLTRFEQI